MKTLIRLTNRLTTFMAKAYERPDLCIEFQAGRV